MYVWGGMGFRGWREGALSPRQCSFTILIRLGRVGEGGGVVTSVVISILLILPIIFNMFLKRGDVLSKLNFRYVVCKKKNVYLKKKRGPPTPPMLHACFKQILCFCNVFSADYWRIKYVSIEYSPRRDLFFPG